MDYTQNLFQNEANVKNAKTRGQLAESLGLGRPKQNHSLLVNIIKQIKAGGLQKQVKQEKKEEVVVVKEEKVVVEKPKVVKEQPKVEKEHVVEEKEEIELNQNVPAEITNS